MLTPTVPISKIGTPFQSPSWRYQAVFCPERFGFTQLCSRPGSNAGHLARLIPKGLRPVNVYYQPIYMRQLMDALPSNEGQALLKVWNKHFFRTNRRKLTFNNRVDPAGGFLCWNMTKLKKLNDDYLVKLIKHCYCYEADQYIDEAIRFYKNESNDMTVKWLNYSIYGGKTDKELALQWLKPVKFIEALRKIFFDYSAWPKDKIVQYSLIRQQVSNNEMDPADYHTFRRIFDLGDLGLRSILGHTNLTEDERNKVKDYLAGSSVDTLMDQRYTISSTRDAMNYQVSVAGYANIGLKRLEMEQRAALMRMSIKKGEKELGIGEESEVYVEDTELMDHLRDMSHRDAKPKFQSFIDVKATPIPNNS